MILREYHNQLKFKRTKLSCWIYIETKAFNSTIEDIQLTK